MQAAVQQLQDMGINLQDGWARTVWAEGTNTREKLLSRFLWSDMVESSVGCLPQNWEGQTQLRGRFVLQLNEVVNVGAPARDRYKESTGSKRCLKLALTDGKSTVWAMELHHCGALSTNLKAGCKVTITDPVVHAGLIMLMGASIRVLGGGVDRLEAARQRLLEHWNQPLGCSLLSVQARRTAEQMFQEARQAAWPHLQQQNPMQHQNAPVGAVIAAGAGIPAAPQPQAVHLGQQGAAAAAALPPGAAAAAALPPANAAAPMQANMHANAVPAAPNHTPLNPPAQIPVQPWQQQPQAAPNIPQLPQARSMALQGGAQLNTFATHHTGMQGATAGPSTRGISASNNHVNRTPTAGNCGVGGAAPCAIQPVPTLQCSRVMEASAARCPQQSMTSTGAPILDAAGSGSLQLQQPGIRPVVNLADSDDDAELEDVGMAGGAEGAASHAAKVEYVSQATVSHSTRGSGGPATQNAAPLHIHVHADEVVEWGAEDDVMDASYLSEEEAEAFPDVERGRQAGAAPAAMGAAPMGAAPAGCSSRHNAGTMAAASALENCSRAGNGGAAPLVVQSVREVAVGAAKGGGEGTFLVRAAFKCEGPEMYDRLPDGSRSPCEYFKVIGKVQDETGTLSNCIVSHDFLVQKGCGSCPAELLKEMTAWKQKGLNEENAPMIGCLESTLHVMDQVCLLCIERHKHSDRWTVSLADAGQ